MTPKCKCNHLPERLHTVQTIKHEPFPWKFVEIRQSAYKTLDIMNVVTCVRMDINGSQHGPHWTPRRHKRFENLWGLWHFDLHVLVDYSKRTFAWKTLFWWGRSFLSFTASLSPTSYLAMFTYLVAQNGAGAFHPVCPVKFPSVTFSNIRTASSVTSSTVTDMIPSPYAFNLCFRFTR